MIAYGHTLTTSRYPTCTTYSSIGANEKEIEDHVRQVLQQLKEFGLYCKAETCQFGVLEVGFLRFVITPDGVSMEADQISTIKDGPTPKSVRDVQVLVGFTNFYRIISRKYAKVTLSLKELLKQSDISRQEIRSRGQMEMDLGSRVGILETEKDLHRGTNLRAFGCCQANHSANRRERIHDCRRPQSVRCFWGSQAIQFILAEVLSSRKEL
jgi:hypothetical protein